MSVHVTSPTYKTKLGNQTAKSVLARLADRANDDGSAFPSSRSIAFDTELSLRQVQRILQVFSLMGLVTRHKIESKLYDHYYQINLEMLGGDLSALFSEHFTEKQCQRLSDAEPENVCETPISDSETLTSVCQTFPPHPLIGVTVIEPSLNRQAPRLPRKAVAVATTILPPWLDAETWAAFREMRKGIKHPMSAYAEKLILKKLTEFEAKGIRSTPVLERSIVNGWRDVFPPEQSNGNFRTMSQTSVKLIETEFKL